MAEQSSAMLLDSDLFSRHQPSFEWSVEKSVEEHAKALRVLNDGQYFGYMTSDIPTVEAFLEYLEANGSQSPQTEASQANTSDNEVNAWATTAGANGTAVPTKSLNIEFNPAFFACDGNATAANASSPNANANANANDDFNFDFEIDNFDFDSGDTNGLPGTFDGIDNAVTGGSPNGFNADTIYFGTNPPAVSSNLPPPPPPPPPTMQGTEIVMPGLESPGHAATELPTRPYNNLGVGVGVGTGMGMGANAGAGAGASAIARAAPPPANPATNAYAYAGTYTPLPLPTPLNTTTAPLPPSLATSPTGPHVYILWYTPPYHLSSPPLYADHNPPALRAAMLYAHANGWQRDLLRCSCEEAAKWEIVPDDGGCVVVGLGGRVFRAWDRGGDVDGARVLFTEPV